MSGSAMIGRQVESDERSRLLGQQILASYSHPSDPEPSPEYATITAVAPTGAQSSKNVGVAPPDPESASPTAPRTYGSVAQGAGAARPIQSIHSPPLYRGLVPAGSPTLEQDDTLGSIFGPGSFLTSIVSILSATMGLGVLALPWALAQCGFLGGMILLLVSALGSFFSIHVLVQLNHYTGIASFEMAGKYAFGKTGALATQLSLLLLCVGGATACILVTSDMLEPLMRLLVPTQPLLHSRTNLQLLLVLVIMLPLSFYRRISSLRLFTLVATLGVTILAILFAVKCILAAVRDEIQWKDIEWISPENEEGSILLALPIFALAYVCQLNVLQIYGELDERTPARMRLSVGTAVLIESVVYSLIAISGYLLYGASVADNVLRNLDLTDPLDATMQLSIAIAISLVFPLNIYPARSALAVMLCLERRSGRQAISPFVDRLLTVILVGASLIIAIYLPSISQLFALLGSTVGFVIALTLPAAFYLKLIPRRYQSLAMRVLCWIAIFASILLTVVTTIKSVWFTIEQRIGKDPNTSAADPRARLGDGSDRED